MGPFLSAALSSTPSSALLFSPPPPPPASDDDDDDDKTIWLNRTISSTSLLANCSSSWSSKESFTLSAVFLNSSADITHPLLLLLLLLLLLSTSSLTDHLFSPGPSFPKLSCKDDDFGGKTSSPLARLLLPLLLLKRRSILTLPCIREERSAPRSTENNDARADEAKPLVPPSKTVKVVLFRICVPEKRECVFWRKNSKNATEFARTSTRCSTRLLRFLSFRERVKKERETLRRRAL